MTTLKQIEANRRNAQHSTGPINLEGKDKSCQNAIKHRLFSNASLITGKQDFLMPQNSIDSILAERVITCA